MPEAKASAFICPRRRDILRGDGHQLLPGDLVQRRQAVGLAHQNPLKEIPHASGVAEGHRIRIFLPDILPYLLLRRLLQQGQKLHPVAGAADEVDAQLLSLRGVGLHIAAAGSHHGLRIAALGPADHLPGFFIALLLLYCFALKLNFFTVLGGSGFGGLLPALALAIPMSAKYIRHIRSNILEEINRDYVAGALVRGIPKATVFRRFILRSLGSTLITLFSLSVGSLLGGTAIIEMIFMIDGIGKMAMDAILMRDYPVVQAYVVWTALIFTCVNLVTDLLLHQLEPQARQFTKGGGW